MSANDDDGNPERDPNFFVNFRRYTDDRMNSIFDSVSDPFRQFPRHDQEWRQAQKDMWKRFERSYERATNPERRQIDRGWDKPEATESSKNVNGYSPIESRSSGSAYSKEQTGRQKLEPQQQGIFSRMLNIFGKTSLEEESARMVADHWKHAPKQSIEEPTHRSEHPTSHVRESHVHDDLQTRDRDQRGLVGAFGQKAADKGPTKSRGQDLESTYGRQAQAKSKWEQERSKEIDRRISRCPWVQEQEESGEVQSMEHQRRSNPYGCSWSWGPWSWKMGSQNHDRCSRPSKDAEQMDTRIEEHTFGPWAFGPFHIGPMSMSASFPQDMEAEFNRAWEEMDKRSRDLIGHMRASQQRIEDDEKRTLETIEPSEYSPVELRRRPGFDGRHNWRQAYEDLLAAEKGDVMLGGTPWSSAENESDDSWRERVRDRALTDEDDPWHRRMLGLEPYVGDRLHRSSAQTSQDAPHTELEFYDSIPPKNAGHPEPRQEASQTTADILSTLTTEESVTNPDGSTTIKRSLKRHFADGRVEREDSTDSMPAGTTLAKGLGDRPESFQPQPSPGLVDGFKNQQQAKGSWFWK